MKMKIGQNFQWLQFKFLNKLSLTETSKMVEALQIFNYLLFWLKVLTENWAHNMLELGN